MSVRLMVLDETEVVRRGVVRLVEGTEIEVVASAANRADALQLAQEHRPDVVVMDVRLADEDDAFDALNQLREQFPKTRVVILSRFENPTYMARAMTLGASDYISQGAGRNVLVESIRAAARGEQPVRSAELNRVTAALSRTAPRDELLPDLTRRETQVLRHLGLGLSNKEIALSLDVSVETIKEHVQNVLRKLKVVDRTQAAVWAVRHGWA